MPTLRRPAADDLDLEQLRDQVDAWYAVKRQGALIQSKLNEGKGKLKELVQRFGQKDPTTGSLFLDLGEPVGDRKISQLKNQRAVTPSANEEVIQKILQKKGLWEKMTKTIVVPDSDAIFAGFYDGDITEDELKMMFPETVSFSFILLDDNGKPVS
jgi:hypothetical protein